MVMKSDTSFWAGKRVLVTGHSGFKGSWLTLWLSRMGANVTGISLPPVTRPNLFNLTKIDSHIKNHFADIRDPELLTQLVREASPEIIFHLAAQPLVRPGYRFPLETFSTNVMGTAHLLESLREVESAKVAVLITTDKVYKDQKWPYPYRENDTLGGHDPYSASKAASEIVAASYRDSFLADKGVAIATARAGNVIGGGDWSEDRLIPDMIRAWDADTPLVIRRPQATRPWQHVLEPLSGYLLLAEKLWFTPNIAGAFNFGPKTDEAATVREVVEYARKQYKRGQVIWGDGNEGPHETGWLGLDISKARNTLGVIPKWSLQETLERTVAWYLKHHAGLDARELCIQEIAEFEAIS
jgi:CDP-glucose 4,6-dehydratase